MFQSESGSNVALTFTFFLLPFLPVYYVPVSCETPLTRERLLWKLWFRSNKCQFQLCSVWWIREENSQVSIFWLKCLFHWVPECDISSRDFSVSRLFSIFWEYRSRSQKFWSRKKVSVSVSKIFSLEKKSRYRSRKYLVSKKSLGIGLENIWSRKKVSVSVSKKVLVSVSKILVSKKVSVMT